MAQPGNPNAAPAAAAAAPRPSTPAAKPASPAPTLLAVLWARLRARFDAVDLTVGGPFVVHMATYWSTGLALLAFERLFPGAARRLKTQPNRTVSNRELFKLLKRVLFNQAILAAGYALIRRFRPQRIVDQAEEMVSRPLPSPFRIVKEYLFNLCVFEVVFYTLHRLLHDFRWYKYVHKIHHQFRAPIALASEYAHFAEFVLSNIVPGAIGPLITRAHPISTWVWLTGSILMTNIHHSGMVLPFYPANWMTLAHDYHHKAFNYQFGVTGAMDGALKTKGGEDFREFSAEILRRVAASAARS